eukprot:3929073-Amphidinium_carterae.1
MNWSVEFNTPPVVLNDGTLEHREDGVPPGTQPHHYVNYYISLHPNPDAQKMKKVKPFRERKTPYADTISDMKRPFDHPRDLPTHVVHNLETGQTTSKPPHEDFYLDGHRMPPCNKGFTGYEGLPLDYKGPM